MWEQIWKELKPKWKPRLAQDLCDYDPDDHESPDEVVLVNEKLHEQREAEVPKYQAIIARNRENGAKGGRPPRNPNKTQTGTQTKPRSGSGVRVKGTSKKKNSLAPPNTAEVMLFATESNLNLDAEAFCDYYGAQGWKLSNGNQMKDWKAAARNWSRRDREKSDSAKAKDPGRPILGSELDL
jgi:hypothetical protein